MTGRNSVQNVGFQRQSHGQCNLRVLFNILFGDYNLILVSFISQVVKSYFCFAGVTIGFNRTNYSVNEADGSVALTVQILDGILDRTAVVNFFTTDGSATSTAPVDFMAVMGSDIVFNAGTISNIEVVTIVNDGVLENVENFFGNLATNDSAVIIAPGMTTVDIVEDPTDSKLISA